MCRSSTAAAARAGTPCGATATDVTSAASGFGITSIYLQGIDCTEIIDTVHARRPPTDPVDAILRP